MEKYYDLLYCLNLEPEKSQRALAVELGISLGQVNYMLRFLTEQGYLKKERRRHELTPQGQDILENMARESRSQKLFLGSENSGEIRTAVILAAGECQAFSVPVGLLKIGEVPVAERLIQDLQRLGVERFILVVGDKQEAYREYFQGRDVQLVTNDRYKWTGTMASLACTEGMIQEDFLLVEGNQILEARGFERLLEDQAKNSVLLAAPSGSGDEAYVELDEQGDIFRISKDIRQMNRVDGELLGVSRISFKLYQKMLSYYRENENPHLNYEYVLETIGRIYKIPGLMADDLAWTVIENERLYRYAEQIVYPRICKKERLSRENKARQTLAKCLEISEDEIEKVATKGGMTNQNFYVKIKEDAYILRLPGAGTDRMIDREKECKNTMTAVKLGLNPQVPYFDARSGIKLSACIPGARTLNGKTARLESNMKLVTELLGRLHNSREVLEGSFDVWQEYEVYKQVIESKHGCWYPGFAKMEDFLYKLREDLYDLGIEQKPCHNDLVAENLVRDTKGRIYLIDWEYAGMNDPMWDLASHLLECGFRPEEEELFLRYYFGREPDEVSCRKIAAYQICQDILWSAWTIAKEASGEEFGRYGIDRFERAIENRRKYENIDRS